MLRYFRILLALFCFASVVLSMLAIPELSPGWAHWAPKWQLIPALLGLNVLVLAVLLIVTAVCGRVYCSTVCPLGVMQDIVIRLRMLVAGKRKRKIGIFGYKMPKNVLRYSVLGIFGALLVLAACGVGCAVYASIVEPYATFGRIMAGVASPVFDTAYNAVADELATREMYWLMPAVARFYPATFAAGMAALIFVGGYALWRGRGYCNEICPVGTLLGLVSRHAWLRPVIDKHACTGCGACARKCKAGCINAKEHNIDLSRCVVCMDCTKSCRSGAIRYGRVKKEAKVEATDASRRSFMAVAGMLSGAAAAHAAGALADGGMAPVHRKEERAHRVRIVPPGSWGHARVAQRCVGCQLCVQVCPSGVIKPSMDVESLMQPYLDFTDGYCTPECTACSAVCPAGVFEPLDEASKSSVKIGRAVVDAKRCIAATEAEDCGNCERHCPAGAITVVWLTDAPNDNRSIPVVNQQQCIGCGACEYHCPVGRAQCTSAGPAAIRVEGLSVHRHI